MSTQSTVLGDDPRWRWLTFAPALAFMLVLSVLPVLNLGVMSFFKIGWKDAKAVWEPVALANYRALGGDVLFGASLRNTVIFALTSVALQMVIGFALALWCSKIARGRTVYRMIFILPL
ncbi:MAG: sugar ABC transporter permease, partial [Alphaproteobacteria bacterium]|nr:sugar ABC transporter permease [Alphaproteobacteria bacterium]